MEKKSSDKILSLISIIILISLVGYIIYLFFRSNINLNSNKIDVNKDISNIANTENINTNTESAQIEKQIIYKDVEIASFTSTLYDNEENRVYNISKACDILNGVTIPNGSEFSFNNTIGTMGEENGYKLAKGFDDDGKLIDIPGGGMCQVSSTLYNVALIANLEITERHPHSRRVYYVPVDKDATIYYPSLDLKFINNTGYDLKISAQNDNYSVTIKMYKIEQSN